MTQGGDPGRSVCPRCGSDSEDHRFCPTCGLDLAAHGELPTRAAWEQERAEQPWPPAGQTAATAAPATATGSAESASLPTEADSRRPSASRLRTVLEVGVPLVVIGVLAVVLFSRGGGSSVPGALHYDSRAAPLMSSLRDTRAQSLRTGSCAGCAEVGSGGGGCSGYVSDWTCDLPVVIHRRDPQIQAAQLPHTSNLLETYKVTWQQNGCWQATEDCVGAADSSGRVCPPPVSVILNGCIQSQ